MTYLLLTGGSSYVIVCSDAALHSHGVWNLALYSHSAASKPHSGGDADAWKHGFKLIEIAYWLQKAGTNWNGTVIS